MTRRAPVADRRARSGLERAGFSALLCAAALGCTRILGIDGDYVLDDGGTAASTGGTSTITGGWHSGGASAGAGGFPTGGAGVGGAGSSASGGSGSGGLVTGGAAGAPSSCAVACEPGTKCCEGTCVVISPDVGCSLPDCTSCPDTIANALKFCTPPPQSECSARCPDGYVPTLDGCVPEGSLDAGGGGAPGTGGASAGGAGGASTGGAGGAIQCANSTTCPPCSFSDPLKGPIRCCDIIKKECGCSWFPVYCL